MALNLTTKTWWIWLITGTLLGILLMVLLGKGCVAPKVVKHLIYKSDTVRLTIDKYIHDTVPLPYEVVLPEKVQIYTPDTPLVAYDADSNDLARSIGYNPYFLWQFRDRPKFISGRFYEDSLSIQILDTSGAIIIKRYPVDYSEYNYFHNSRELMRVDRPKKPSGALTIADPIPNITTTGNFYGYYSLIHGGFTVAADYWAIKGKWGLGVLGELNSYPRYGNIKLGVKYQFK